MQSGPRQDQCPVDRFEWLYVVAHHRHGRFTRGVHKSLAVGSIARAIVPAVSTGNPCFLSGRSGGRTPSESPHIHRSAGGAPRVLMRSPPARTNAIPGTSISNAKAIWGKGEQRRAGPLSNRLLALSPRTAFPRRPLAWLFAHWSVSVCRYSSAPYSALLHSWCSYASPLD
jgi:hypothetical protein